MITTTVVDTLMASGGLSSDQVTVLASPIWDIGANLKNQGIKFAVFCLMGGTALVAAISDFVAKNKTIALRTLFVGVVLIGLVQSLPALGVVSADTACSLANSTNCNSGGGYR